jgi:uncharacterized cofD-like protein
VRPASAGTAPSAAPPAAAPAPRPVPGPGPARPAVVALGGGHGLSTTLRAARRYAGALTAVVSVADDGGSSGRLREMYGLPAPGDLRRCLVALADPESLWAQAFEHRFGAGDLDGHALGNIIIAGLAELTGDFGEALDAAAGLLGVTARVLPATEVPVVLKADAGGTEVLGQVNVQESRRPISSVSIVPPDAAAPAEAVEAVERADQVVIGPGSLFTSVLATCVVPAVREAIGRRRRGTVYVCNLRPQDPETAGFAPVDHLRAVLDHGVVVHAIVVDRDTADDTGALAELADTHGVEVVVAPIARPGRGAHDAATLAEVLSGLARIGADAPRPPAPHPPAPRPPAPRPPAPRRPAAPPARRPPPPTGPPATTDREA